MTEPCNTDAARLLPWFVTGRLDADDVARVETHVASCPGCRADLEHERALHGVLRQDPQGRVPGAAQGFEKLMARIGETERAIPPPPSATSLRADAGGAREPRWFATAVLVQAVALALVGAALWLHTERVDDAPFRTLTSAPAATERPAHVRVVFAPGTTTQELAGILDMIDARIVDGPSPAGAYALALTSGAPDDDALRATLATLRADARVILAEPIRAEPAP